MKVLRWGLIGAGDIAKKRIAPALRDLPNCDLVSVSRSRFDLAQAFAAEFGARKWFADWRELVSDSEIDAVYVATPVFLHKEQTIAAAAAGKHVLCEKPMALKPAECTEMLAACRDHGVRLGIAYYRRFFPVIKRVKQIIAGDEIGKIVAAQINVFEPFNPAPEHSRFWLLQKKKSGGGPMMDFGCHRLELLTDLFGTLKTVKSLLSNSFFEREVEDTAMATLHFESGVCANLTVSHAAFEPQDTLDIFGTRGSIRVPVLNKDQIIIKTADGERVEFHTPDRNVHLPLISDFTEAVLQNRQPQISGETGKLIAELEEIIYKN